MGTLEHAFFQKSEGENSESVERLLKGTFKMHYLWGPLNTHPYTCTRARCFYEVLKGFKGFLKWDFKEK